MTESRENYITNGGKIRKMPNINKSSDRAKVNKRYNLKPCPRCKHYKICTEPCGKVDRFSNQDDNEDAWKNVRPIAHIENLTKEVPKGLSTCEAILINYFVDRMTPPQIAKKHYKSRQYVYRIIKRYSAIIIQNIKKSV
jgi:radical SAM protein with 4Fe4S-binding SPASM domain